MSQAFVVAILCAALSLQAASPPELGAAWMAFAEGRFADAAQLAQPFTGGSSDAAVEARGLRIRALGGTKGALAALGEYERWVRFGEPDDLYLLNGVAHAVLLDLTTADDPRVRVRALRILSLVGDRAARLALAHLAAGTGASAVDAETALLDLGEHPSGRGIAAAVAGRGQPGRLEAVRALGKVRTPAAEATLLGLLRDDDPQIRASAVEALGGLPAAKERTDALRRALSDRALLVRLQAALALARLGDQQGKMTALQLMDSPNGDIRLAAAASLVDILPGAADTLVEALTDENPLNQVRAAAALGRIEPPHPAAQRRLEAASADLNPNIRLAAVEALTASPKDAQTLEVLRRALFDADPRVRIAAAAVVEAGARRAFPSRRGGGKMPDQR